MQNEGLGTRLRRVCCVWASPNPPVGFGFAEPEAAPCADSSSVAETNPSEGSHPVVAHRAKPHGLLVRGLCASLVLLLFVPLHAARADDAIDPSLIPDGTYPAHVDKVINAQHIAVTMQGTLKVFLASGRATITFTDKIKVNDDIVVTLTDGKVTEYAKK